MEDERVSGSTALGTSQEDLMGQLWPSSWWRRTSHTPHRKEKGDGARTHTDENARLHARARFLPYYNLFAWQTMLIGNTFFFSVACFQRRLCINETLA